MELIILIPLILLPLLAMLYVRSCMRKERAKEKNTNIYRCALRLVNKRKAQRIQEQHEYMAKTNHYNYDDDQILFMQ